jgi:hypothetical protein
LNRPKVIPAANNKTYHEKLLQTRIFKDLENPKIVSDERKRYGKNQENAKANKYYFHGVYPKLLLRRRSKFTGF